MKGDYSYDSGRQCFNDLASANRIPDAVIAANDAMAIGCIDEARSVFNLAVPEDLSVVEAGKSRLELSDVDIRILLENSLNMVKEKAYQHRKIQNVIDQ